MFGVAHCDLALCQPAADVKARQVAPAGGSRYGAIVTATGETLEPSRSDHCCRTPAFGVAAVAGRRVLRAFARWAPEFPFDIARRGYSVGTKVL
jgi:hypothetical protein